jgi:hypothetical protein
VRKPDDFVLAEKQNTRECAQADKNALQDHINPSFHAGVFGEGLPAAGNSYNVI